MSSVATAAVFAAARRASQQACAQHAQLVAGATAQGFCSAAGALLPSNIGRLQHLFQHDIAPVQQLISLRRHFSAPPAVPGGVPGTRGGGSAETQAGAGSTPESSAEGSIGASTESSAGAAEASFGLGPPGRAAPMESGTGLSNPDAPSVERHEGARSADSGAPAEHTATPPSYRGSDDAAAEPSGEDGQQAEAATAAHGDCGSSKPEGSGSEPEDSDMKEAKGEDGVVRAEMKDEEGILSSIVNALMDLAGSLAVSIIPRTIETDFSESSFLESAKDAFWIVNKLFSEGDFETLAPMVSQNLLAAFRATHDEYASKGYTFQIVKQEVTDASVIEVTTLAKDKIAQLDPPLAALAPDPLPPVATGGPGAAAGAVQRPDLKAQLRAMHPLNNTFLVISVRFRGTQELETRKKDGGKLLSVLTDRRSRTWRFVLGPLSAGALPVRSLELPWKVFDVVA